MKFYIFICNSLVFLYSLFALTDNDFKYCQLKNIPQGKNIVTNIQEVVWKSYTSITESIPSTISQIVTNQVVIDEAKWVIVTNGAEATGFTTVIHHETGSEDISISIYAPEDSQSPVYYNETEYSVWINNPTNFSGTFYATRQETQYLESLPFVANLNSAKTKNALGIAMLSDIFKITDLISSLSNRIVALETQLSGLENTLHIINTGTNIVSNGGN